MNFPNGLEYTEKIFSQTRPDTSPRLPPSFTNLIPSHHFSIFKQSNPSDEQLRAQLKLNFADRYALLSVIIENKLRLFETDQNKLFTSIIILQSLSPAFFSSLDIFDIDFIGYLLKLIKLTIKNAPQLIEFSQQAFCFYCQAATKHSQFVKLLPDINKFLRMLSIKASFLSNASSMIFNAILKYLSENPNEYMINLAISFLREVFDFIKNNNETFSASLDVAVDVYSNAEKLLNKTTKEFPNLLNSQIFIDLRYQIITICLYLHFSTGNMSQKVIDIITNIISTPLIVSEEEMNLKEQPCMKTAMKQPKELIYDEDSPISWGLFMIPELRSIDSFISTLDHPLRAFIEYINEQSEDLHLTLIKLIIDFGDNQIINGDINLQVLLFVLLKNLSAHAEIVSSFFESESKSNLFFTLKLFNPAVTFFNRPNSNLIMTRFLIITMFKILIDNSNQKSFYIDALLNFLNTILIYPGLFAEFFFFTYSTYNDLINSSEYQTIILNLTARALEFQQTAKFLNLDHHRQFRSLTFKTINNLLDSLHKPIPITTLLDVLLNLIFEKSVSDLVFTLLKKYMFLFKNSKPEDTVSLFKKVMDKVKLCKDELDLFQEIIVRIFDIFYRLAISLPKHSLDALIKSSFFNQIRNMIFIKGLSIDSIAYSLKILHLSPPTEADSPYDELARIIAKHEMTEKMYEAVLISLSHTNEPFKGIANANAAQLIVPVLSSRFCLDVLKRIYECVSNSIPDCISLSKTALMTSIINILTNLKNTNDDESSHNEIFEIVMEIIKKVYTHVTSRQDLLTFFRLFSPVSENKQCDRILLVNSTLIDLVSQQPVTFRSVLCVSSKNGSLVLPQISPKTYLNGFALCFHLLMSNFRNENDSIQLFKLSSNQNPNNAFKCMIKQNSFIFTVGKLSNVSFDVKYPKNKWFTLNFIFKSFSSILIYVDNKLAAMGEILQLDWIDSFTNNFIFGGGTGYIECLLARFAIFENPSGKKYDFDILKDEGLVERASFLIDSKSYYIDETTEIVKLHNLCSKNEETNYFDFNGILFKAISCFNRTFEYTKGLEFVLSLFSQLTFAEDNRFFIQLIEVLCIILQLNDHMQKTLAKLRGFEIISYFLLKSKITIDWEVSSAIFKIHPILVNEKLKISFARSILLNYPIWENSTIQIRSELFKAWLLSTNMTPLVLNTRLRPLIVINILKKLCTSGELTNEIRGTLFDILLKSMSIKLEENDMTSLIELMKLYSDQPDELIIYLKMLSKFIAKYPKHATVVARSLISTSWLALYSNLNVQLKLIKNFARHDLILFSQYVLMNVESSSLKNRESNDKLLTEFCCHFVGVEGENLSELIDKSSEWKMAELFLPVCLSAAFFTSEEVITNFATFMFTVLSSQKRLDQIKCSMTPLTLLLLTCFALFHGNSLVDYLKLLLVSDPSLCANCFRMIDLISYTMKKDFHQFQNMLASKILIDIFEHDFEDSKQEFLNIIIDFISFNIKVKYPKEDSIKYDNIHENNSDSNDQISSGNNDGQKLTYLLKRLQSNKVELPRSVFYLKRDEKDNKWMDFNLVEYLAKVLPKTNNVDCSRFLILLSFACHKSCCESEQMNSILDTFINKVPLESKSWIPVIYQVSRHAQDFKNAKSFFKAFGPKLKPSIELYESQCKVFKTFIESYSFISTIDQLIAQSIAVIKKNNDENIDFSQIAFDEMVNDCKIKQMNFEDSWNKLQSALTYEGSPFYYKNDNENKVRELTRGNFFDIKLRPTVNTKVVSRNISNQNNCDNRVISKLASPSESLPIFSGECTRIKFTSKSEGTLFLLNDCIKFIPFDLKIIVLKAEKVYRMYFFHKTLQFFMNNHKCYLFKLENLTTVINDMQKSKFAQIINNMSNITEKWLNYQVSNFDYILWLNYINGNSFLDKENYPIFPELDEDGYLIIEKDKIKGHINIEKGIDEVIENNYPEIYFDSNHNDFEQLHKMNELLESDKVSMSLHKWISIAFGEGVHQVRGKSPSINPPKHQITIVNNSAPVVDFFTTGSHCEDSITIAILEDGAIHSFTMTNRSQSTNKLIGQINKYFNLVTFMPDKLFFTFGPAVGVFDWVKEQVVLKKCEPSVSPITSIASSKGYVVSGAEDGAVILWDVNQTTPLYKNVLLYHQSPIQCLYISEMFGICVSCDTSGIITTSRISDMKYLTSSICVENERPKKVALTSGLGYIIVLTQNSTFINFTLSLKRLKTAKPESNVVDFCTFQSKSGHDYLAVVNESNRIIIYDACTFEEERNLCKQVNRIRKIKYSTDIKAFVLAMADSPIVLIPYELA
ncbi:hypothetical protein TRFO_18553 [Tritrichomonas foetus]|uniref:BEACH domain-containing protein n=1 Tax=Tritrichomonas foetus TaxID=1144522 RepID=A0A1J4KL44_9EUKA|nr:hypothetical protein TRFO_18553 [Tritrichomonas foetus]|eukprot:OHT11866.1 hypothetical protein TRFO_18553 [Tritrichomonas foetus]